MKPVASSSVPAALARNERERALLLDRALALPSSGPAQKH